MSRYHEVYAAWKQDPEAFWADAAREIDWINLWDKVFDPSVGIKVNRVHLVPGSEEFHR